MSQDRYLRRQFSRFVFIKDGWESEIKLLQIKDGKARINYCGRERWFWVLPDGSLSSVSIEPAKRYLRTLDGFRPSHNNLGYSVSGVFPFFKINETDEWVWLDYDGRLYHRYVNFVERCDEWYRVQHRQNGRIPEVSRRPGERKRAAARYTMLVDRTADVAGMTAYMWSVWRYGKRLTSEVHICEDPKDALKIATKWVSRQKRSDRRMENYLRNVDS